MPTQAKVDQVSELREKLEKCSIAVTTTYTNISVNEMTELRRQVRAAGVDFLVVKNTLMSRAADAAQLPQIKEVMQGPTAVAFGYDEPVDVARILHDYIRTNRSPLTIQGAVMGSGPALNNREVERLSSLPSKPQLIAQLLGQMQAPIYGLLRVLNGPLTNFGYLLQARIRQLEAGAPVPVADAVPAGEEASPEAAEAAPPEATAEVSQAAPAGEMDPTDATSEVSQAEPVEQADPTDATSEVSQAEPVEQADPTDATAEASQSEPVEQADPTDATSEVSQSEPVEQADPTDATAEASQAASVEEEESADEDEKPGDPE